MFGFFFRLALLLAVSQAEVTPKADAQINYRLPENIIPLDYVIQLTPTLHKPFLFKGICVINAEVKTETKEIILHSRDLEYDQHKVEVLNSDGKYTDVTVLQLKTDDETEEEKKTDFLVLQLKESLQKGKIRITLQYSGVLNENLRGFYRSSYINKDKQKR